MNRKTLKILLTCAVSLTILLLIAVLFFSMTGAVIQDKEEKIKPEKIKPKDCQEVNGKLYCKIGSVNIQSGEVKITDGLVK